MIPPVLRSIAAGHPYPLLFASISGAHLYGFASPDSDYDLRGVHVLPAAVVAGLRPGPETIERMERVEGLELDLVTHEAAKFFRLLLTPNGYVLEHLASPLVVVATPVLDELRALVPNLVTRGHAHHYRRFAAGRRARFEREDPPQVKTLLYVYRVLLTGIRLLRTGDVEASLPRLLESDSWPGVDELIAQKREGPERAAVTPAERERRRPDLDRLEARFEAAAVASRLPEAPSARAALDRILLDLRTG